MSSRRVSVLNDSGFSVVMILLAIVMVFAIGAVGYKIHTRSSALTVDGGGTGRHGNPNVPAPRHGNGGVSNPNVPAPSHGTPPPPRH